MINRRRRFKQTVSLKDRLEAFANDLRHQAIALPPGEEKSDLLKRVRRAETAADLDNWANSSGLKPPT